MFEYRKDYVKCLKVIASCKENIFHLTVAHRMVYNYGKMYNFNHLWTKLDIYVTKEIRKIEDKLKYMERIDASNSSS